MRLAQQLKKSILQSAFEGKLTHQNSNENTKDLLENISKHKQKNQIKNSNIKIHDEDIPYKIPVNWSWVKLGDVTTYGLVSTFKPTEIKEGSWILELADIEKDSFKLINKDKETKTKSTKNKFNKGDVLYGKLRPYLNKVIVADEEGFCSTEIVPFHGYGFIVPEFLMYLMGSPYVDSTVNNMTHGMDMPRLGTRNAKSLLVPIPPFEEQQRIVAKIEELLPLIEELELNENSLLNLDEQLPIQLRKSILQSAMEGKLTKQLETDSSVLELMKNNREKKNQLVDSKLIRREKELPDLSEEEIIFDIPENWVWNRLGNVSNIYTGNSIPKHTKDSLYTNVDNSGLPYVATKDVGFDTVIDYDNGVTIPRDEPKFKLLKKNNVLLCIEGGSAGRKIGITDQDIFFGNKLATFESYVLDRRFIYYFLQSPGFLNDFYGSMTGIIGGVGTTKLKSFPIPIPPLEEQQRIVEKLDQLFGEIDLLESNE